MFPPALVMKAPTNTHAHPGTEYPNSEYRAAKIPDIRHGMGCKPLYVCVGRLFVAEKETDAFLHMK